MLRSRTRLILLLSALVFGTSWIAAEQPAVQVLIERARTLDAQGRHDLAAEDWHQVLLLEPRQPEGVAALASYYRSIGNRAKAKYYEGLIGSSQQISGDSKSAPHPSVSSSKEDKLGEASRLAAAHKYSEAMQLFRDAFGSTPPDNWASLYYQTEAAIPSEAARGIAGLRALAVKFPANPAYQLTLAEELSYSPATRAEGLQLLSAFQGSSAQNEEARVTWRKAILWDPASRAAIESSKAYLERFDDPDLAASIQAARGKGEGAAPKISPEEGAAYRALGTGKLDDAAARFSALLKSAEYASHGELGLGYVSMKRGDFEAAVHHFETAATKGMHSAALEKALQEARYWAAMSNGNRALKDEDTATATAEFQLAQQIDAHRPEAAEALGDSMIAAKEPAQAEDILAADVKNNPNRADAWIGWMNALLEAGRFDRVTAIQQQIPSNVKLQLNRRPDYLAMLLCAELARGNEDEVRVLRDRITRYDSSDDAADSDVTAAELLYRFSYFDDASRLAVAGLNVNSSNTMAWQLLVEAEHMAGRDKNALSIISRMPRSVDETAMKNAGFLLALASIYQNENKLSLAESAIDRAQQLSGTEQRSLEQLEMQKASLAIAQDDPTLAYETYQRIAANSPDKLDAWIGMLNALHAGGQDSKALSVMDRIPEDVSARLSHDSEYLQAAGFIYSATGHPREANRCLHAVTEHYEQSHLPIPFGAGIALAWLQLDAGDQVHLAQTLDQLGKRRELSLAQTIAIQKIWSAWSMRRAEAAFDNGNTKRALAILETATQAYPNDAPMRIQLAGMYVRTGRTGLGMKLFRNMDWDNATVNQFIAGIDAAIASNSMSDAQYWLYRALEKYPDNTSIMRAGAHLEEKKGDLKAAEKYLKLAGDKSPDGRVESAQRTSAANDTDEGVQTDGRTAPASVNQLPAGNSVDSSDDSSHRPSPKLQLQPVRTQVEGQALSSEDSAAAVEPGIYRQNSDASLVRVASTQESAQLGAEKNVDPRSSGLDEQNSQSASNVKLNATEDYDGDRRATAVAPRSNFELTGTAQKGLRIVRSENANNRLASVLVDNESAIGAADSGSSADLEAELLGVAPPVRHAAVSESSSTNSSFAFAPEPGMERGLKSPKTENPSDELEDLQARYSPWLLGGGSVESHSGTSGFDRLEHFEAGMGASTVLGTGTARISVITRPVLLQSGVPDTNSNYRFGSGGSLPTSALFAGGTAAALEIATPNIEASVGNSPSGFPVNNVVGSFTYRPHAGPFTFNAYRASQKDSLLSYAGFKDPTTGEIWGGVVASGASVQYSRGTAVSGFYGSFDAQRLTGLHITANTRVMGDAGAYWQPYFNQYGALKVGANLNIMHYALNERYFTIGQGGYFSPDAFLLMNAPISWEGKPIYNTSYMVSASLGVQSVQQAAAMPGSLVIGNGAETSAGPSYDFHLKIAHRMDQHWTIEGFLDANNARQYQDLSAGFTVRYATRPQSGDNAAPGFLNLLEPLPLQAP